MNQENVAAKKLSTESYKGVRDFYPEDMFIQNYIFKLWKDVVESFGYQEYNASVFEPSELYKQKSGEEIVNEQTYTFVDRGEREVTLRPEMTPTVARLVAGKIRELVMPLRWYSIPNLFRYEKPQRGRLREHWQLNVDLFGLDTLEADAEIIMIADAIMKKMGAIKTDGKNDYTIKINNRKIINAIYDALDFDEVQRGKVSKLIDKKDKISAEVFESSLKDVIGEKTSRLVEVISDIQKLKDLIGEDLEALTSVNKLIDQLFGLGINTAVFVPTLMRGFDYYTGMVFEVFDNNPENDRSVFGGGRYDDLLSLFGDEKIPAVGFGAGDVTARDFMESRGALPTFTSTATLAICTLNSQFFDFATNLATTLRGKNINCIVDYSDKKVGDKIKNADKQKIPFVIVFGEDEVKSGKYHLKNLASGQTTEVDSSSIFKALAYN